MHLFRLKNSGIEFSKKRGRFIDLAVGTGSCYETVKFPYTENLTYSLFLVSFGLYRFPLMDQYVPINIKGHKGRII